LPAGELLASGQKVSFFPADGEVVLGYEIDDEGTITERYLNGQQVSVETWQTEIAKHEGLRNSNLGEKPLYGMKNLVSREASRFLEPPTPADEKIAKEESTTTQRRRRAKWRV
jgi:hypothetical protein